MQHELSGNKPISKLAIELNDITDRIKEIWREREGPFENIFRILSYLIPFVPGLGWGLFILEQLGSAYGFGLGPLGAAIDNKLGLYPGTSADVSYNDFSGALSSVFADKTASSTNDLVKLAWLGGFLKLIGGLPRLLPKVAVLIWKAVKFLLLAFGVTKLGDLYTEIFKTSKPTDELLSGETEPKAENNNKPSGLTSQQLSGLADLVQNPSELLGQFLS